MKNILTIAALFLLSASAFAQKVVEKTIPYSGKESIRIDVHITDSIGISTWSRNEVYVKAIVNIEDNRYNDEYRISFDESGNAVGIFGKYETDRRQRWNDSNCCRTDITWEIHIPENARFSVETINGNITIVGKTDEMRVSTISGFIDLEVPASRKADFRLSTITGTIYSNVLAANENNKGRKLHSDVINSYNGGGKPVNLKTISGDIYLRKQ